MKPVTAQQRANAEDALLNMWPSVPPENVAPRLGRWRGNPKEDATGSPSAPPSCHTLACFGAWCAWWPAFQRQGVFAGILGQPALPSVFSMPEDVASFLFGDEAIFDARGDHTADRGFAGTDHALVTHRLRWLIENSEVSR